MKILLATDGSTYSEAALQSVAARPWPEGSEVKVLAVVEMHIASQPGIWLVPDDHYLKTLHELQERARTAIELAESTLKQSNAQRMAPLQIGSEIIVGNAKETILKVADEWAADLIVLGSHGHNRLERMLLGSVSQAITSQAHCSVEVVRSKES
jgi:nucleotide-binding universal stress UspA family protein